MEGNQSTELDSLVVIIFATSANVSAGLKTENTLGKSKSESNVSKKKYVRFLLQPFIVGERMV